MGYYSDLKIGILGKNIDKAVEWLDARASNPSPLRWEAYCREDFQWEAEMLLDSIVERTDSLLIINAIDVKLHDLGNVIYHFLDHCDKELGLDVAYIRLGEGRDDLEQLYGYGDIYHTAEIDIKLSKKIAQSLTLHTNSDQEIMDIKKNMNDKHFYKPYQLQNKSILSAFYFYKLQVGKSKLKIVKETDKKIIEFTSKRSLKPVELCDIIYVKLKGVEMLEKFLDHGIISISEARLVAELSKKNQKTILSHQKGMINVYIAELKEHKEAILNVNFELLEIKEAISKYLIKQPTPPEENNYLSENQLYKELSTIESLVKKSIKARIRESSKRYNIKFTDEAW
jgi:hypothetical protein